jgi:hypothetical protein
MLQLRVQIYTPRISSVPYMHSEVVLLYNEKPLYKTLLANEGIHMGDCS